MSFFRQYIAPALIVLIFLVALLAVSARIFLPTDMATPAPISTANPPSVIAQNMDTAIPSSLANLATDLARAS